MTDPTTSPADAGGKQIPDHIVPCTGVVTVNDERVALVSSAVVLLGVDELQALRTQLEAHPGTSAQVVVTLSEIATALANAGH